MTKAVDAKIDQSDYAGTLAAFGRLMKDGKDWPDVAQAVGARLSAQAVGARLSAQARATGGSYPDARARAAARTVDALSDRSGATVVVGGSGSAGLSGGASFSDIAYGSDVGALDAGPNGWRFPSYKARGRWLTPVVEAQWQREADKESDRALRAMQKDWART